MGRPLFVYIPHIETTVPSMPICITGKQGVHVHYQSKHEEGYRRYCGESRSLLITKLKQNLKYQTTMLTIPDEIQTTATVASYEVFLILAKLYYIN